MLHHQTITSTPAPASGVFDAKAALQAFTTIVGADLGAALRELNRLRDEADAENDADHQQTLDEVRDEARDYVLALPIRRLEDVSLKAEFVVRHCHLPDQLQTVLLEIAAFGSPDRADPIVPAELF